MEDVLDVSAENLEQLKEEAAMVRDDTLMRYIRIFSELAESNQICRIQASDAGGGTDQTVPSADGAGSALRTGTRAETGKAAGIGRGGPKTAGHRWSHTRGNFDYQNRKRGRLRGSGSSGSRQAMHRPGKLPQQRQHRKICRRSSVHVADDPGTDFTGVSVWFWQVPFRNLIQKKKMVRFISYFLIFWERLMSMIRRKQKHSSRSLPAKTGRQVKVKMILQADEHVATYQTFQSAVSGGT